MSSAEQTCRPDERDRPSSIRSYAKRRVGCSVTVTPLQAVDARRCRCRRQHDGRLPSCRPQGSAGRGGESVPPERTPGSAGHPRCRPSPSSTPKARHTTAGAGTDNDTGSVTLLPQGHRRCWTPVPSEATMRTPSPSLTRRTGNQMPQTSRSPPSLRCRGECQVQWNAHRRRLPEPARSTERRGNSRRPCRW